MGGKYNKNSSAVKTHFVHKIIDFRSLFPLFFNGNLPLKVYHWLPLVNLQLTPLGPALVGSRIVLKGPSKKICHT